MTSAKMWLHFFLIHLSFSPICANDAGGDIAAHDSYEYYEPENLREYDSYYEYDEDEEQTKGEGENEDGQTHEAGNTTSNHTEDYHRWELPFYFYFSKSV